MTDTVHLRAATSADAETLLSWVSDAESCRLWAGPNLVYPATPASLWAELDAEDTDSWALIDAEQQLLGFGQTLGGVTERVHLARLIVAPHARGRGLGRRLCEQIMEAAFERHRPSAYTLNVYLSNTPALKLYRSLGFEPASPGLGDFELLVLQKPSALPSSRLDRARQARDEARNG